MTQERMQQRASLQAFLDGSLVDRAPNLSTSLSHQQREEQTPSPSQLEQLAYRMVSHDGVPTITLQEKQDDYDTFENDTLWYFFFLSSNYVFLQTLPNLRKVVIISLMN